MYCLCFYKMKLIKQYKTQIHCTSKLWIFRWWKLCHVNKSQKSFFFCTALHSIAVHHPEAQSPLLRSPTFFTTNRKNFRNCYRRFYERRPIYNKQKKWSRLNCSHRAPFEMACLWPSLDNHSFLKQQNKSNITYERNRFIKPE